MCDNNSDSNSGIKMIKLVALLSFVVSVFCIFIANAQVFKDACVQAHNRFRSMHGAPNVTLDDEMQTYALQWAQHLAKNGLMEHRKNNKYGENIYSASGINGVTGFNATKAWYDEIKDYDYNNPGFKLGTGHFTQVVWKGSLRIGCGFVKNGSRTVVVANYDPPGNFQGQFPQNVLKKK